mmetsp:Transcript_39280/g.124874  ORF Transcript_39280/g.124874 Transcript_39280/m.124874 type:complete len:238 (-) Transcript_39280:152-865(-)
MIWNLTSRCCMRKHSWWWRQPAPKPSAVSWSLKLSPSTSVRHRQKPPVRRRDPTSSGLCQGATSSRRGKYPVLGRPRAPYHTLMPSFRLSSTLTWMTAGGVSRMRKFRPWAALSSLPTVSCAGAIRSRFNSLESRQSSAGCIRQSQRLFALTIWKDRCFLLWMLNSKHFSCRSASQLSEQPNVNDFRAASRSLPQSLQLPMSTRGSLTSMICKALSVLPSLLPAGTAIQAAMALPTV